MTRKPQAKPVIPRWATLNEAAAYARVHRSTMRGYISEGLLPASYMGKRRVIRVDLNDVDRMMQPVPAARRSA